ncbi:hypothetical protein [uncultured Olegusella sp.]|uniref:hypothetical protein n=1 Tax=uncultured Olegusella sp. TaxID=1979846 RepID=UPI002604C9AD|nr:hypothetical protein [uncultured Olegusella sp.]
MDEKRIQTVELQVKASGLDDIEKQLKRIRKLAKKTSRELDKVRGINAQHKASMKAY